MKQEEKYFFCYSTNLSEFLIKQKGINSICVAFHHKTKKRFWLFERTEAVKSALEEYTQKGKDLGLRDR